MKIKKAAKKTYNFLFKEDSVYSYIAFTILAFIVLKWLVLPGILLAFNLTDISAIVSGSMTHSALTNYTYKEWLLFHGYNYSNNWPFPNGINVGDVVLIRKAPPSEIHVGDVIMYRVGKYEIVHRVINKTGNHFQTKGDANPYMLPFEHNVSYSQVKGVVVGKIPYLGWPKVLLTYLMMGVGG